MPVLKKIIRQILFIAILAYRSLLPAQIPVTHEYQVKAAFLFNFAQFVEWPHASFSSGESPFIIGVLGDNPFGSYLEYLVSGEKVNGHPMIVKYYKNSDDIEMCHVLFINKTAINNGDDILPKLKGRNMLMVSDASNFLQRGGMIRFYTKNNKIQLQINLDAVKADKLDISSKLLRVAEIIVADKK
ncbi:MAG: YfiR family protein [Bacteroidetes bacterium]|nr:YfiR family protein [Bacteroidota bacterium]